MELVSLFVLVLLAGIALTELRGLPVARLAPRRTVEARDGRSRPGGRSRMPSTLAACASCP